MPDAKEEIKISEIERRIESKYHIMRLEGMGSTSHDLGAELEMHPLTANCDTILDKKKVAIVALVTSVRFEATVSKQCLL